MIRYTPELIKQLMQAWKVNPQPSLDERRQLALETGLKVKQVSKWFAKNQLVCRVKQLVLAGDQREVLFRHLEHEPCPSVESCHKLASELGITEQQVHRWFVQFRPNDPLSNPQLDVNQLRELTEILEHYPYVGKERSALIGRKLDLSSDDVKRWFNVQRQVCLNIDENENPDLYRFLPTDNLPNDSDLDNSPVQINPSATTSRNSTEIECSTQESMQLKRRFKEDGFSNKQIKKSMIDKPVSVNENVLPKSGDVESEIEVNQVEMIEPVSENGVEAILRQVTTENLSTLCEVDLELQCQNDLANLSLVTPTLSEAKQSEQSNARQSTSGGDYSPEWIGRFIESIKQILRESIQEMDQTMQHRMLAMQTQLKQEIEQSREEIRRELAQHSRNQPDSFRLNALREMLQLMRDFLPPSHQCQ